MSIGERARVDLPYMAQLTGKPEEELTDELEDSGAIYLEPITNTWQTADEYLSGNVRRKLREARRAAAEDPAYRPNVDALTAALPKDLEASEIEVRLGATWIAPEYIQRFMYETFRTPAAQRENIRVIYVKATASWFITNKSWILPALDLRPPALPLRLGEGKVAVSQGEVMGGVLGAVGR